MVNAGGFLMGKVELQAFGWNLFGWRGDQRGRGQEGRLWGGGAKVIKITIVLPNLLTSHFLIHLLYTFDFHDFFGFLLYDTLRTIPNLFYLLSN